MVHDSLWRRIKNKIKKIRTNFKKSLKKIRYL